MRKRYISKGFTLIEMLIAVSIFSTIAVVLYSSFRGGVLSWRRINSEFSFQQKLRYATDRLSKDIRNTVFLAQLPFEGSPDKIQFTSLAKSSDQKGLAIVRMSYYLVSERESTALMRSEEALKNAVSIKESEADKEKESLIKDISGLKFSYLSISKGADEEEEPEYEWVDNWEQKDMIPLAIKVEFLLNSPEGGRGVKLSKRIYLPIGNAFEKEETTVEEISAEE